MAKKIPLQKIWPTIVISILLGAVSGSLAAAWTTDYLADYSSQLDRLTQPLRFTEERPRSFPQSFEEAISEVKEKAAPSLVTVFLVNQKPTVDQVPYQLDRAVASGAVLTSDGWLAVLPSLEQKLPEQGLEVLIGRTVYSVERVEADTVTNVHFLKIEAAGLPVVAFGNGLEVETGDQLFALPAPDTLVSTSVTGLVWGEELLRSSDLPSRYVALDEVESLSVGTPVANIGGELVGLIEDSQLLPLQSFLPSFQSLLRTDEIIRPTLGVQVVDLTHTYGLDVTEVRLESGAWLPTTLAIPVGTPAAQAGLLPGDIIVAVDGQIVNGNRTLDERLAEYSPLDEVVLLVDRDGQEVSLSTVLGPTN